MTRRGAGLATVNEAKTKEGEQVVDFAISENFYYSRVTFRRIRSKTGLMGYNVRRPKSVDQHLGRQPGHSSSSRPTRIWARHVRRRDSEGRTYCAHERACRHIYAGRQCRDRRVRKHESSLQGQSTMSHRGQLHVSCIIHVS